MHVGIGFLTLFVLGFIVGMYGIYVWLKRRTCTVVVSIGGNAVKVTTYKPEGVLYLSCKSADFEAGLTKSIIHKLRQETYEEVMP